MWIIIKEKFIRTGPAIMGGRSEGRTEIVIDKVVKTLDEIKSGEMFVKCNVKK